MSDVTDIMIPSPGDFGAWEAKHKVCIAVDWDGTCKDTMTVKWATGFNLALTEIWPALAEHQKQIDKTCWDVNLIDDATAGVPRFVGLMVMMQQWGAMGLPVPDLKNYFRAVKAVQAGSDPHSPETYQRLAGEFDYDDSVMRWSARSDEIIAANSPDAIVFDHCIDTLAANQTQADVLVCSASKTAAVLEDLQHHDMTGLFRVLLGLEFAPKSGILTGLAAKYDRVLFLGDTHYDVLAARAADVPLFRVQTGNEGECWAKAAEVLPAFIAGEENLHDLTLP